MGAVAGPPPKYPIELIPREDLPENVRALSDFQP
jgi:hypothetical protein